MVYIYIKVSPISCLNFWEEFSWFLLFRIFGLLFSSFFLIFTTYRPSSDFYCRNTYLILSTGVNCSDFINHNRLQVLSIPVLLFACSQDSTCNHQMIVTFKPREPTHITVMLCVLYDVFTWAHITIFLLSNLFVYCFPYCIHLYTWSTQQVTVAQRMSWFYFCNVLLNQLF